MKLYRKENNKLIIEVPLKTRRFNPYNEMATGNGDVGEMDNIIGLYENEYKNGLCFRIDMDYKDKSDQWSDYFFKLDGTKKEFEEMCLELEIDAIYDSPLK